jgi:TRAP-type C4-dicarboxylate transport system permease small subunit
MLISKILVVLTFVMLISIFLQVVTRLMSVNIIWTSDLATFSFVWIAFLGAAIAVTTNEHFIVDIFPEKLKTPTFEKSLSVLSLILQFIVGYVMVRYGIAFTESMTLRFTYALGIKMSYISCVLPVSGTLIITGSLERLLFLNEIGGRPKDTKEN